MDNIRALILRTVDRAVCVVLGHRHDYRGAPHLCRGCGKYFML